MNVEFKKENSSLKKLFFIVLCFVILLLTAVAFLTVLLAKQIELENSHKNICNTKSCIKAANLILENIDESVDPCEDFYQFSCGSFITNKRIQDDQSKIDELTILRDRLAYKVADLLSEPISKNETLATANAKRLFISCVDEWTIEEKGADQLLSIIDQDLGGWPILQGKQYDPDNLTVIDKMLMLKSIESPLFFEVYVTLNPKDPKHNILRISQPEWFFNKEYLLDGKIMYAYKNFMRSMIYSLSDERTNLTKEIDRIFEIEKEFSMLQIDDEYRRNSIYKNMTLKELQSAIPDFEWTDFIYGMFSSVDNLTITEDEIILIDDFKYLEDASRLYKNLLKRNKRDLENFLIWLFVKDTTPFLPKHFQELKLEFDKAYEGTSIKQPRSLSCSNFVNSKMEYAVGRLYVQKYFDSKAKDDTISMINNLQHEFRMILNETDWMDEFSKRIALEKVNYMDTKIGYSDELYNDTYLDQMYDGFNFTESDLLENYYYSLKMNSLSLLSELRKEQNPKNWISGPAVVNAFYSPTSNQICFPAGILQPPFYDYSHPKYLNYGGIGTVIGHEITHGFDDQGRLYDKDGVFYSDHEFSLWSNKTVENYKLKAQCIVEQYSNFVEKQVGKNINGINTQGENIADNGGLKESFRAYKKWTAKHGPEPSLPGLSKYTNDQMFFISFGQLWCGKTRDQALTQSILNDAHSPGEFRIIGSTSNSDEFSKAFKCKAGQKNNPVTKCAVW